MPHTIRSEGRVSPEPRPRAPQSVRDAADGLRRRARLAKARLGYEVEARALAARRAAKRAWYAADDSLTAAARGAMRRPALALASAVAVGAIAGLIVGYATTRRRRGS